MYSTPKSHAELKVSHCYNYIHIVMAMNDIIGILCGTFPWGLINIIKGLPRVTTNYMMP